MSKQKIEKWKVLGSEYIAKEPWFTARRDKVELPNGVVISTYYVLEYPKWICVLAITKEGQFIMERQYRHGMGVVAYELCAGVVDPTDDTPMDAAKRELEEETGYGNGHWEEFMVYGVNPGTHNNLVYCFLATGVEKVTERHLEPTEDIAVELMSREEVEKLMNSNQIMQVAHLAPLWKYFALQNK